MNIAKSLVGVDDITRHNDPDFALSSGLAHGPCVRFLSINRLYFIWRPAKSGNSGAKRLPLIISRSQIEGAEATSRQDESRGRHDRQCAHSLDFP